MWVKREMPLTEKEKCSLEETYDSQKKWISHLYNLQRMGISVDSYKFKDELRFFDKLYMYMDGFEWVEPRDNTFIMI